MKNQIKQTNYSSTSTDSFIQTLENLRREADENTKKEQMDAQERERKLREEIHTAVGFPRYYKRVNAFYRIEQMKDTYKQIYRRFADEQQIEL